MGKVYSLIDYRHTTNSEVSEIKDQTDLVWNTHNARNAYKRNLLNLFAGEIKCQIIHIDFKAKKKVA